MRLVLLAAMLAACTDTTTPVDTNEGELITTVELTFAPVGGGEDLVFTWGDPENDGDPAIDAIQLSDGVDYTLSVRFLDELASPAEDITEEVADEADEHQVFFTGDAVSGPASSAAGVLVHRYADTDMNGLPIGLDNEIDTDGTGTGTLTVTLRHLPPEGNAIVKVEGLAETVASEGFGGIGGDSDASVDFPVEVVAR
ncbi:MAG: hypothetical protein EP330_13725 [Deltaproteobacteria bacterium]|nr:MAG: hypothetical protein EP330_13725 [Deltaproteobacteria bacterium]